MKSTKLEMSNNLKKVIYIALSFMVLFSAFGTSQTMMASIYKGLGYDSLAQTCLFIMASFSMMGSVFATQIRKRLPVKIGLTFGGLPYLVFITMGTMTTYCHKYGRDLMFCSETFIYTCNFLAASTVGMGAAVLWASQFNYVNGCTNATNKGTYHGIFWSIMQTSMLMGTTMAAFVLRHTDEFTFYMVLCAFCAVAVVMMFFIPVEPKDEENAEVPEPLIETVKTCFRAYKTPHFHPIIASSLLNGITVALLSTYFSLIVKGTVTSTDTNVVNQKVAFALMSLGIGQILSGFSIGRFLDKFTNIRIDNYIFGSIEFVTCLCFVAKLVNSYHLCIIAGFIWGVNDNALKTFNNTLVSKKYKGGLEAFGALRVNQSSGVVLGSLCALLLPGLVGDGFVLCMLGLQVACHVIFKFSYDNLEPKKEELGVELLEQTRKSEIVNKA